MSHSGGNTYQGTIPASSIRERGVEYYIASSDGSGNTATDPETDPENHPHAVRISFSGLNCPYLTPTGSYSMISLPADLDSKSPGVVLEDDFGIYDDTQWRLLRWESGSYREYTVHTISTIDPGRAFWLITRGAKTWDTGSGRSVSTSENAILTLEPGWNQIGVPFAFTVDWDEVIKNGNVEPPVAYGGSANDTTGYLYNQAQLEPWKGYCVKNLEGSPVTIDIPPVASGVSLKKSNPPYQDALDAGEWIVQILARCHRSIDAFNFIGCLKDAEDEWDPHDFSEAPPIGDYVSLYFPREEWQVYGGDYTTDFRAPSADGVFWDFQVSSNLVSADVNLSFKGIEGVPGQFDFLLIDRDAQLSKDLREECSYTYSVGGNELIRHFRLIAGSEQFSRENDAGIDVVPGRFRILQNAPNPFNSMTTLQFWLPEDAKVDLRIYNGVGKEVSRLIDCRERRKGYHTLVWNGRDNRGVALPSGLYFCTMRTAAFKGTIKMMLIR